MTNQNTIEFNIPAKLMEFQFCPKCNIIVMLRKEEINVFLFVFLLIFTCGIGALIYFLYYRKKNPLYCSICGLKIKDQKKR